MALTRVALVALPKLMDDLVRRACQAEIEIEVGPSIDSLSALNRALKRRGVDVAIIGTKGENEVGLALSVLSLRPRTRVLLIAVVEGVAEMFALHPQRTPLGAVTPADIVRVVRDDGAHAVAWAELDALGLDRGR